MKILGPYGSANQDPNALQYQQSGQPYGQANQNYMNDPNYNGGYGNPMNQFISDNNTAQMQQQVNN